MTDVGGLDVLFAWTMFGALLAVLAYLLLRHRPEPVDAVEQAERETGNEHHG